MSVNPIFHACLFVLYAAAFLWAIYRLNFFKIDGINRNYLSFFFLLKVVAGVGLTLVYTYYYTDPAKADIYRYFRDSKIISSLVFTHPLVWLRVMTGIGMHNARVFVYLLNTLHFTHPAGDMATSNTFIIRLISLMNYLSFSNIYINTLFFDFISFVGLTLLLKCFRQYIPQLQPLLFVPLFLMPSVIFWGSGLLKEGIILFGIGIYIRYLLKWEQTGASRNLLWAFIGLLVVAWLKIHIAALLVLCSVFLPLPISAPKRIGGFIVIVLIGLWLAGGHFCDKIIDKRNEFIALSISENAGSAIHSSTTVPDCEGLISSIPSALFDSIVRPLVWEGRKPLQLVFALQNTFVLLLLVFLLFRYFKFARGKKRSLFLFCLSFSLLNYLVIGLTVPVLGAIVHYRVIAEIFLFLAVLMLTADKIPIQIKKIQI